MDSRTPPRRAPHEATDLDERHHPLSMSGHLYLLFANLQRLSLWRPKHLFDRL
jgi:hypothetical protein